ncbi:3TM-type holin [Oleispirillum naphthae]|uniref:3TM-type holin n=1 Tax=Oleispirillum naphthae TaxID=2838853 RepID=UPI003082279A
MAFGIDDAIAAGLKIIDKFVPDPAAKTQAEADLRASLMAWDQGQAATNTAEAQSGNWFVAGWRPWIGWVCGLALGVQFVVGPLAVWAFDMAGHPIQAPPALDDMLWELMFGMLGLGGLRTFEKIKGVARK